MTIDYLQAELIRYRQYLDSNDEPSKCLLDVHRIESRDVWVGQYFNEDSGCWETATDEYDNADKAELMLYRWYLGKVDGATRPSEPV